MKKIILTIAALSSLSSFADYNCSVKVITQRPFFGDKEHIALEFSTSADGSTRAQTTNVLELKTEYDHKYIFWFEGEATCNNGDCSLTGLLRSTYNDGHNIFVSHGNLHEEISIKTNQEKKYIVAMAGNKSKSISVDCK